MHTPGPSLCKSTEIENDHNGLICQIMISKEKQAMNIWHLRLYRQGAINILYSCRSSLFCNSQHYKPKKSAPLQHIFLLSWISRTQKMMLHLRQWHHTKHSPHFFREFVTFGEARMMTTTGNTFLRGGLKTHFLSPLKWMLSSLPQCNLQDLWTLLLLPWALS